jgi:hypothetical protein
MIKPFMVAAGSFGTLWLLATYGDSGKFLGVAIAPVAQGTAAAAIVIIGEFLRKYIAKAPEEPARANPVVPGSYEDLVLWASEAEAFIARLKADAETTSHRQELLRLFIASALAVALASCVATFIVPPAKSQQDHIYLLGGGYAIAGILTGLIAHLRLSIIKIRHVVRLGFISAFYAGAIALLISVGYGDRWSTEVSVFGLPRLPLLIFVTALRLVILPFIACFFVFISSRISRFFFPR